MSRSDGFVVADVNVALLEDPKMRALWRLLRDRDKMARATVIYLSTVLGSWREGKRLSANLAAPLWMDDVVEVEALQAVGLLDEEMCINEESWEGWFGAARDRRDERRRSGSRGGSATAQVKRSRTSAVPDRTVPTVPSRPTRAAARETPPRVADGRSLKEIVAGLGHKVAVEGEP